MLRAGTLFDLGRFDDAEAAYKKYFEGAGGEDRLRFVAREGMGVCEEAKGKNDEALAIYQDVEKAAGDFYRDRAMFDQARVLARKGDKKSAADIYKKILEKSPATSLKDEINARLASLES
jgi:tetratricopeptide (TPR) repeat protein